MKKLILKISITLLIGVALLFYTLSCQVSEDNKVQDETLPKRINIVTRSGGIMNINIYEIVEVDGIEYLTTSHGGIIALPKR